MSVTICQSGKYSRKQNAETMVNRHYLTLIFGPFPKRVQASEKSKGVSRHLHPSLNSTPCLPFLDMGTGYSTNNGKSTPPTRAQATAAT